MARSSTRPTGSGSALRLFAVSSIWRRASSGLCASIGLRPARCMASITLTICGCRVGIEFLPGSVCSGSVSVALFRHRGQLEQDVAGRLRINKGDAAIAVADNRHFVQERCAFRLEFGERSVDVVDLEADME